MRLLWVGVLVACSGPSSPASDGPLLDGVSDSSAIVDGPPDGPPPIVTASITILHTTGFPLQGERILVHGPRGEFLADLATPSDGRIEAQFPEGGSLSHVDESSQDRWINTFARLRDGDAVVWGARAPRPPRVSVTAAPTLTMPDAVAHYVRIGGTSQYYPTSPVTFDPYDNGNGVAIEEAIDINRTSLGYRATAVTIEPGIPTITWSDPTVHQTQDLRITMDTEGMSVLTRIYPLSTMREGPSIDTQFEAAVGPQVLLIPRAVYAAAPPHTSYLEMYLTGEHGRHELTANIPNTTTLAFDANTFPPCPASMTYDGTKITLAPTTRGDFVQAQLTQSHPSVSRISWTVTAPIGTVEIPRIELPNNEPFPDAAARRTAYVTESGKSYRDSLAWIPWPTQPYTKCTSQLGP